MITAVIAEKPSVAKDIANVLNVRERHDGYLSGNGYLVTWAFGHHACDTATDFALAKAKRTSGLLTK